MPDLAIDTQYVASLATNYAHLNSNLYSNYQNAFQNYLLARQSAGPDAIPPVEPTPPQLVVFDTNVALQLVLAYDYALGQAVGNTNVISPSLNLTPAISYVQAAKIQIPVRPVVPTPNDPVGPAQGAATADGHQMFYTVTGDALPSGAVFTDTRGTFVKIVINTPFGGESFWEKVA